MTRTSCSLDSLLFKALCAQSCTNRSTRPRQDSRKFASHRSLLDAEGDPILDEQHNYITIRGYYNGPDEWVPEHEGALLKPVDLAKAVRKGLITDLQSKEYLSRIIERLRTEGYDGTLLKIRSGFA